MTVTFSAMSPMCGTISWIVWTWIMKRAISFFISRFPGFLQPLDGKTVKEKSVRKVPGLMKMEIMVWELWKEPSPAPISLVLLALWQERGISSRKYRNWKKCAGSWRRKYGRQKKSWQESGGGRKPWRQSGKHFLKSRILRRRQKSWKENSLCWRI